VRRPHGLQQAPLVERVRHAEVREGRRRILVGDQFAHEVAIHAVLLDVRTVDAIGGAEVVDLCAHVGGAGAGAHHSITYA
jgi:hypothetical protein